jgi:hypothetical protein
MPTGYTAPVVDGKIIEFSDFALSCARAFGALISMRDEPMNAPIPDELTPNVKHYDERIEADLKRMGDVQAMTRAQADEAAAKEHSDALASRALYLAEQEAGAARLNAMMAKVRAWEPPTSDHAPMKLFMLEQLRISLPSDYAPAIPEILDGRAWRQKEIDRLSASVVRDRKYRDEEIDRAHEPRGSPDAAQGSCPAVPRG